MSNEAKKPDSYTSEFKESAVKLALESEQPIAQTARDLGINLDKSVDRLHLCISHSKGCVTQFFIAHPFGEWFSLHGFVNKSGRKILHNSSQ